LSRKGAAMPVADVLGMIAQALRTMAIGISGVFAVLAIFYLALRLLMATPKDGAATPKDSE